MSRYIQNVAENKAATDEFVEQIKNKLITGRVRTRRSRTKMRRSRQEYYFKGRVNRRRRPLGQHCERQIPADKNDVALGQQLLVEFTNNGNYDAAIKRTGELAVQAIRAGQVTQAFFLLKTLTPQGALNDTPHAITKLRDGVQRLIDMGRHIQKII